MAQGASGSAVNDSEPAYKLKSLDEEVLGAMVEGIAGSVNSYSKGKSELYFKKEVSVKIDTTPSGARIYNGDGTLRGTTPYEITERSTKSHSEKWTIRADGYKEQTIEVGFDEAIHEKITLESTKEEAKPKPKPQAKPKPKPKPKPKSKNNGSRTKPGRRLI